MEKYLNKINEPLININTKKLLASLINGNIVGGKHTPEHKIIKSKTKNLPKAERKQFFQEYEQLIKNQIILREKKRTKKDYDCT